MDDEGNILIGAGTTFTHLTGDPMIKKIYQRAWIRSGSGGRPQVRNIGHRRQYHVMVR